ncbi:MAG: hypothetical protein M0000_09840 [Actinomycetota bacterium]|nr:hypothetical protein [Actinomycetota bacterium]
MLSRPSAAQGRHCLAARTVGDQMRSPEMARAITRRWISEVPSKMV